MLNENSFLVLALIWVGSLLLAFLIGAVTFALIKLYNNKPKTKVNVETGRLVGISGAFVGKSMTLSNRPILIGRDPTVCQLVFEKEEKGVSRTHCSVRYDSNLKCFFLEDLSSYGTFLVDGSRLSKGKQHALRPGEKFYLADKINMFLVDTNNIG